MTEQEFKEKAYKDAEQVRTLEDFQKFYKQMTDHMHDYGTIIYAYSAVMIAVFNALNRSPSGGITGFQAGCIGWEMIGKFIEKGPAKILFYKKMLYPQYYKDFARVITKETWEYLQKEAQKNLEEETLAPPSLVAHWESIVKGEVPFGYDVKEATSKQQADE